MVKTVLQEFLAQQELMEKQDRLEFKDKRETRVILVLLLLVIL